MPPIATGGQPLPWGRKPAPAPTGGGLTSNQKAIFALAAVLIGPAAVKHLWKSPKSEVDLSKFNVVTRYDTPAIEKRDGTLRIEFCQA